MRSSFPKLFFVFFILSLSTLFVGRLIFQQSLADNIFVLVIVSASVAAVTAGAVRWLYLKPMRVLTQVLSRISQGASPDAVGLSRKDEIGDLVLRISEVSQGFRNTIADLNREREEIKAVLSSMSEAVLLIGRDERIIHMSAVVPRLLDLRPGETIGRPYWEAVRHDEINSVIKGAIHQALPLSRDVVIFNPDEQFFNVQLAPVFGLNKEMISLVVVMHDISALKKYERMRSEFVANVSHELKTPLTSIRGYAETLKTGAIDDKEAAYRFVGIIDDQARRLESLVSDILSLARVEAKEAGQGDWMLSVQDIRSVLEEALSLQEVSIRARRHQVSFLCPEESLMVRVDRREIEHVFLNLIDNAVKFTPEGGRIVVRVMREDRWIRVDVEDNGIGIENAHIERLFERFYRVDTSRSREMGGTGLGLSIVKHIVQAHQGKMTVQSRLGQGSTFSVFLPQA